METGYRVDAWLPTTKKEVEARGWDYLDVILFSGDAYVDHPSFGAAVIGRTLEALGLRVAIVPQPDWHGDYRDFKKLGTPRLFFGVSAGAMDSMINHYTANKRLRSDDAYTPDRRPHMRPDYPSIVYTKILKELYPDTPVVLGGIEASLRRVTHYDYWQDKLLPSILVSSGADLLIYGMGEQPIREIVHRLQQGEAFQTLLDVRQTAYLASHPTPQPDDVVLFAHEECLKDKLKQAKNFRHIEEESNKQQAARIRQRVGQQEVVVNPPFPPMTEAEIDASFDLPYTRLPHPKYKGKVIPAFEMIQYSVNIHRGCFGGCAFCTISAHQGKFIASRSQASILREVKQVTQMPGFKGYLSDLGGPSANMYRMQGKDRSICAHCKKPSCISPAVCPNLNADHTPLLELYKAVDQLPGIKRSFIGSGVRYDLLLHEYKDPHLKQAAQTYTEELIARHVSGRLKVAPEHTQDNVLQMMRKPTFKLFEKFKRIFDQINQKHGLKQQLIPYFISSHPGCRDCDMAELAIQTKRLHFQLEQVQDFTPTPMTLATEMYYTGYHPYTLEKVYTARSKEQKLAQRQFFFWYKPEFRRQIQQVLLKMGRRDLWERLK
ncbi:MAG: YgiQ family radical SAM protein [Parabacteroides sp.]|nr:YgiQ family radical SAM protein [Parabacteroides distasonis]MCI6877136.1 YgiQ family radical SAM protein [Parabacteroides sp.]MDD6100710.1 YgiQ family radical SAM protein [bacterium]MDD6749672.1 YgiQ family radical SAM protein [bacterium]MDD6765855.1 YgiQ family radical SAM protein [bacterium]